MKIKINDNLKFFYLNFLFLITPFIQFFQSNFDEISFYLNDLVKIFIFFLLIFTASYFFIKNKLITILSFFYFILFQFSLLNLLFNELLSLFLIIFFLIIFIKYLISNIKFVNFLIIFLTINIIFFLISFLKHSTKDLEKYINFEDKFIYKNTTFSNPRNIYLIIPDEMVSTKYFADENILINDYKEKILQRGSTYIDGTYPAAKETIFNFMNILQLTEVKIDQNFKDYHNLVKYFFQNPRKSKLLNLLYNNDYQVKLIGNPFMDCDSFDEKLCLISKKKNFTNIYVLDTFLSSSPFGYFREKIKRLIKSKSDLLSVRYKNLYYENDAIGKFINSQIEISKLQNPHFFIIHHLSPHDPFLYNEDCSFRDKVLEPDWDIFKDYSTGYKAAYICALKKVLDIIDFINEKDENALIIVQGDTGPVNDAFYDTFPKIKRDNLELFSIVNSNSKCEKKISKNISNIRIIDLMIRCSFDL